MIAVKNLFQIVQPAIQQKDDYCVEQNEKTYEALL